jgi:hypothetical protein
MLPAGRRNWPWPRPPLVAEGFDALEGAGAGAALGAAAGLAVGCTTSALPPVRAARESRAGGQGLQLAGAVQGLLDLGHQLVVGERLADVVGDAGLDGLHHVLLVAAAGDHDERGGLEFVLPTAPGEQFEAGQLRHFPVAEDQVGRLAGEHLLGLAAVDRFVDLDAGEVVAQALLHQITDKGGVVHHQHTDFAHRPLPTTMSTSIAADGGSRPTSRPGGRPDGPTSVSRALPACHSVLPPRTSSCMRASPMWRTSVPRTR